MMTEKNILQLRDLAEQGLVQFKERTLDKANIAAEMVAMSNSHGGRIIIGINDKTGEINAMSYTELQETCETLGNLASTSVVPSILIDTENVPVEGGAVTVATIKEGLNKPYKDSKGIVWVKNGSDKRKVFDNAELAEMMTDCGSFAPDEAAVQDATVEDLDEQTIKHYISRRFAVRFRDVSDSELRMMPIEEAVQRVAEGLTLERLLRNLKFIRPNGRLTVAAMLLFGKYTQRWLPTMTTKCISFVGNSIGGTQFRDKVSDSLMEGNLLHQFECVMSFFSRNLRQIQVGEEFNQQGQFEIPIAALQELVVNAMVHRSLNWSAPIRIFIFDNRIEIHSPGALPGGLTVEDILAGTSMPRNNFLFNNAIYSLPYTGIGTGIKRALDFGLDIEFSNNESLHEFLITIHRDTVELRDGSNHESIYESNHENAESNQVSNQVVEASNHQKLTKQQEDIRNFCSVPRTSQEIMDRLGITNQSKNRQKYIGALIDMGVLEMTIPDNPKDKNQKYRRKAK